MKSSPLYQQIARRLAAFRSCDEIGNAEWAFRHKEAVEKLVREHMPSGAGFNQGTTLDFDAPEGVLRFKTSFHHMDEHGGYDGWTDHVVTVRPDLQFGIDLRISGRDKNGIKDLIFESFHDALKQESPQ